MLPAPVERAFSFAVEAYRAAGLPPGSLLTSKDATHLLEACGYRDRGLLCASMLFGTSVVGASLPMVAAHFGNYAASIVDELRTRPTPETVRSLSRSARTVMLARVIAETMGNLETSESVQLGKALAISFDSYSKNEENLCKAFWRA